MKCAHLEYFDAARKMGIDVLPVEILLYVFMAGMDSSRLERNPYALTRYLNLLTSTCSYWRSVAIQSKQLWTQIAWDYQHHPKYVRGRGTLSTRPIVRIRTYLQRSDPNPIDIRLRVSPFDDDRLLQGIHSCLGDHVARARTFKWEGTDPTIASLLPLRGVLNHLVSADIARISLDSRLAPISAGTEAPRLRSITLQGRGWKAFAPPVGSIVERLHLNKCYRIPDMITCLSGLAHSLRHLLITSPMDIGTWGQANSIRLHSLQYLSLLELDFAGASQVWEMPALGELSIRGKGGILMSGLRADSIVYPSLRILNLCSTWILPNQLLDLFHANPTILVITLSDSSRTSFIPLVLLGRHDVDEDDPPLHFEIWDSPSTPPPSSAELLPALTHLRILHTVSPCYRGEAYGLLITRLMEQRPQLVVETDKKCFQASRMPMGEVEKRFGERFKEIPSEDEVYFRA